MRSKGIFESKVVTSSIAIVIFEQLFRLEKSDEAKLDAEIALKINKSSTKLVSNNKY